MSKTTVKKHPRKTTSGRTSVKRHSRLTKEKRTNQEPKFPKTTSGIEWFGEAEHSTNDIFMPPEKFLELTGDTTAIESHRSNIEWQKSQIQKGETSGQPPYLIVNGETGRVFGHEGRHRAVASKEMGIMDFPVTVRYRYVRDDDMAFTPDPNEIKVKDYRDFKPQMKGTDGLTLVR